MNYLAEKLGLRPRDIVFFILMFLVWLAGCASAPRVGPCTTTTCGIVCCNNDGLVCPPCK